MIIATILYILGYIGMFLMGRAIGGDKPNIADVIMPLLWPILVIILVGQIVWDLWK